MAEVDPNHAPNSPVPWLKANWIILVLVFGMGGAYAESRWQISTLKDKAAAQIKADQAFQELKAEVQTNTAVQKLRDEVTQRQLQEIKELIEKMGQ